MKFYIAIEEVRSTVIEVEAEGESVAIEKVENAYYENEICLDNAKYVDDGTCFYDETDRWSKAVKLGLTNFQVIK